MGAKRGASKPPKGRRTKRPRDGRHQASLFLLAVWRRLQAWWPALRKLMWRVAAFLGTFFLFLTLMVALAGWYTSRSEFCNSCHIMEPYYVSWQESSHANVACIKCHFAPGFGRRCEGRCWGWCNSLSTSPRAKGRDRPLKFRRQLPPFGVP